MIVIADLELGKLSVSGDVDAGVDSVVPLEPEIVGGVAIALHK